MVPSAICRSGHAETKDGSGVDDGGRLWHFYVRRRSDTSAPRVEGMVVQRTRRQNGG